MALLRGLPQQKEDDIDVDAAVVLQLQARLRHAGAAVVAEREGPERVGLRGGGGLDAAHGGDPITSRQRKAPPPAGWRRSRPCRAAPCAGRSAGRPSPPQALPGCAPSSCRGASPPPIRPWFRTRPC